MKYFITGERNVGKTYLINRLKPLMDATGFETRLESGGLQLYLHFFSGFSLLVGERARGKMKIVEEGFQEAAKRLRNLEIHKHRTLVMDEIGFLEEESPEFQHVVVSAIRRSKNCICVLRKGEYSFIEHLKSSMGIRSIELNRSNREDIYQRLVREIEKERTIMSSPGGDEGI